MSSIKTGVSIREDLARGADALAEELKVTRSQLYAMALEEFIEKRANEKLLEQLNDAYSDGLDEEEKRVLARAREYYRDRFGADG